MGETDETTLKIFIDKKPESFGFDEFGRSNRTPVFVNHYVGDGQSTAPVDAHRAVYQCPTRRQPSVFDRVENDGEMLQDVVVLVVPCVELDVLLQTVSVELGASAAYTVLVKLITQYIHSYLV